MARGSASMTSSVSLTVEEAAENAVKTVTLDRPEKANALNRDLVEELFSTVAYSYDDGTRVLVLKGAGTHFCGGFDLSDAAKADDEELFQRFVRVEQLLALFRYSPFLSIACVQGSAIGAGADLTSSCHYRLGAPNARFRFPGFRFGISLGTRHLAHLIGPQRARDILLSNAVVNAEEAAAWGLLTEVCGPELFQERVAALVSGCDGLDDRSLATILRLTRPDTRDADLAEVVSSATVPGLSERVAHYRAVATARPGARC